ncbi:MAG: preprotein translocase subunit SecG [Fibrobacterales bacterium]
MFWVLIAVHVLLCAFLVLLVLVQSDKGGGLGSLAGGMGNNNALAGAGAETFIQKLTKWVAITFMVVVFALNMMAVGAEQTVQESELKKSVGLGDALPQVETQQPVAIDTTLAK